MEHAPLRCPICPGCNKPMVASFAFAGYEWVCLVCDIKDEFFPANTLVVLMTDEMKKEYLYRAAAWADDLHAIAVKGYGACRQTDCALCKDIKNYKFKYWKPQIVPDKKGLICLKN